MYNPEVRIPVFRMPQHPDELRQSWLRALHREDLDNLKTVFVWVKHFREEDIEYTHKVPNGDGTYREIPRKNPKLKSGQYQLTYQVVHHTIHSLLQNADVSPSIRNKMTTPAGCST